MDDKTLLTLGAEPLRYNERPDGAECILNYCPHQQISKLPHQLIS